MRAIQAFLASFILTVCAGPALADVALPDSCSKTDLMEVYKTEDPALYREIVDTAKTLINGKTLLWRVEHADSAAPSYLFGTMHNSDPRILDLPSAVKQAFKDSRTLAIEGVGLADGSKIMGVLIRSPDLFLLPDYQRNTELLTEQEVKVIGQVIGLRAFPQHLKDRMQPWFIMLTMAFGRCAADNRRAGLPLDARLEADALASGKTVIGLETARMQMEALASTSLEHQLEGLRTQIRLYPLTEDLQETIKRAYLRGEVDLIYGLSVVLSLRHGSSQAGIDDFFGRILDQRNFGMRDKSLPLLREGGAFIAVGALHLPGKNGLVDLFRRAGYTVTPVK